jgi:Domain of unknown function (DUF4395)
MSVLASTELPADHRSRPQLDPRGPRFGAAVTTVVLAAVLLTLGSPVAAVLLTGQLIVFGLGAFVGPSAQPYGLLYRRLVRPRLAPPAELEDAAPPKFAQLVGLVFAAAALAGLVLGALAVAYVAVAAALAAAFLNAAFDYCLGCEIYLLAARFRRPVVAAG